MIRFILVQNRQGKTRLAKWFTTHALSEEEQQKIKMDVHSLLATRDQRMANIVEYKSYKIVYRRYAGLYFCFCVDAEDSELGYLEMIHFFVELLDAVFKNVCELDLVFHFHKVYAIVDELFLGGEVQETSKTLVLQRLAYLEKQAQEQSQ